MVPGGPLVEIMVKVDPWLYSKYVTENLKVKPLLYVNMHKALYGILFSQLLLLKNIVKNLEDDGF